MYFSIPWMGFALQWCHIGHGSVSNHLPHDCLLNCLFRRWSRKATNLRVTGFWKGNSPVTGEIPHKGPVIPKMLPFDDVIMGWGWRRQLPCSSGAVAKGISRIRFQNWHVNLRDQLARQLQMSLPICTYPTPSFVVILVCQVVYNDITILFQDCSR